MDGFAVGAGDVAGAVGVDGELPAEFVQDDVVVPPAVILEVGQAGGAAVLAVDHVVGFALGRGLITAARVLAVLVSEGDQAAQVDRDVVGLAVVLVLSRCSPHAGCHLGNSPRSSRTWRSSTRACI